MSNQIRNLNLEVAKLLVAFIQAFKPGYYQPRARTMGRESEHQILEAATGKLANATMALQSMCIAHDWQPKSSNGTASPLRGITKDWQDANTKQTIKLELVFDASYSNVELISWPCTNLNLAKQACTEAMDELTYCCTELGHVVLTTGTAPFTLPAPELWIPTPRYNVLRECLGEGVNWAPIMSSRQVSLGIGQDEIMEGLRCLSVISTCIVLPFVANSPVWGGQLDPEGRIAVREDVWKKIAARDPERVGLPCWGHVNDYFQNLLDRDLLFWQAPTGEFCKAEGTLRYFLQHHELRAAEALQVFRDHTAGVWTDVRARMGSLLPTDNGYKPCYTPGYLEVRPLCQQPQSMGFAMEAVLMGLACNLSACKSLVDHLDRQSWCALKRKAIFEGPKMQTGNGPINEMIWEVVAIAEVGLIRRELDEHQLLEPFKQLLDQHQRGEQVLPFQRYRETFLRAKEKGVRAFTESADVTWQPQKR